MKQALALHQTLLQKRPLRVFRASTKGSRRDKPQRKRQKHKFTNNRSSLYVYNPNVDTSKGKRTTAAGNTLTAHEQNSESASFFYNKRVRKHVMQKFKTKKNKSHIMPRDTTQIPLV